MACSLPARRPRWTRAILLGFVRDTALLGNDEVTFAEVLSCVPDKTGPKQPTADAAIDGTLTV